MISKVDVLTSDVLYRQSCYVRFIYSYEEKNTTKTEMTDEKISALSAEKEFLTLIKRKISIQRKVTDLFKEIANLCEFSYRGKGRS